MLLRLSDLGAPEKEIRAYQIIGLAPVLRAGDCINEQYCLGSAATTAASTIAAASNRRSRWLCAPQRNPISEGMESEDKVAFEKDHKSEAAGTVTAFEGRC